MTWQEELERVRTQRYEEDDERPAPHTYSAMECLCDALSEIPIDPGHIGADADGGLAMTWRRGEDLAWVTLHNDGDVSFLVRRGDKVHVWSGFDLIANEVAEFLNGPGGAQEER